MKIPYYISEVFHTEKYTGNMLATFIIDDDLPDQEIQNLARLFNISATSFIISPKKNDERFRIRIFTPEGEINFGGHSVMGTAYIIWQEILKRSTDTVNIELLGNKITVQIDVERQMAWVRHSGIHFGAHYDKNDIAPMLGLSSDDISEISPIRETAAEMYFIIVPVVSLQAMKQAWIDRRAYSSFFTKEKQKPFYLFCTETYRSDNNINARVFAHTIGIPEDPATGSGAAALGAYLRLYYSPVEEIDFKIEQGYEMHKRSLIELIVEGRGAEDKIKVGGKVHILADGKLL